MLNMQQVKPWHMVQCNLGIFGDLGEGGRPDLPARHIHDLNPKVRSHQFLGKVQPEWPPGRIGIDLKNLKCQM